MKPDDEICYCYHVSYRKLWSYAARQPLHRPSQMSECLGAGTGCGWCIPILRKIFENAQAQRAAGAVQPADAAESVVTMTPEEYAQERQAYIREKRPRNQF